MSENKKWYEYLIFLILFICSGLIVNYLSLLLGINNKTEHYIYTSSKDTTVQKYEKTIVNFETTKKYENIFNYYNDSNRIANTNNGDSLRNTAKGFAEKLLSNPVRFDNK